MSRLFDEKLYVFVDGKVFGLSLVDVIELVFVNWEMVFKEVFINGK